MSHLSTLRHIKGLVQSTNAELKTSPSHLITFDDALEYVSSSLAIYVGKALLKQTALLLPEVYDTFRTQLLDLTIHS